MSLSQVSLWSAPTRPGFDSRIGTIFFVEELANDLASCYRVACIDPCMYASLFYVTICGYRVLSGKLELFPSDHPGEVDCGRLALLLVVRTVKEVTIEACLYKAGKKRDVIEPVVRFKDEADVRAGCKEKAYRKIQFMMYSAR